jgi:hypothetical protein
MLIKMMQQFLGQAFPQAIDLIIYELIYASTSYAKMNQYSIIVNSLQSLIINEDQYGEWYSCKSKHWNIDTNGEEYQSIQRQFTDQAVTKRLGLYESLKTSYKHHPITWPMIQYLYGLYGSPLLQFSSLKDDKTVTKQWPNIAGLFYLIQMLDHNVQHPFQEQDCILISEWWNDVACFINHTKPDQVRRLSKVFWLVSQKLKR